MSEEISNLKYDFEQRERQDKINFELLQRIEKLESAIKSAQQNIPLIYCKECKDNFHPATQFCIYCSPHALITSEGKLIYPPKTKTYWVNVYNTKDGFFSGQLHHSHEEALHEAKKYVINNPEHYYERAISFELPYDEE